MLSEILKHRIKNVDVLSDFDQVMIEKNSIYSQVCAYFSFLPLTEKWNFSKKLIKAYNSYRKERDLFSVYSLFAGCPVEVIDKIVPLLTLNNTWSGFVRKLGVKKIGVVSRNNARVISRYLDHVKQSLLGLSIEIIVANNLEDEHGIYTGRVQLLINNANLESFIKDKGYICGRDEKKILKLNGLQPTFSENGLFLFGNV